MKRINIIVAVSVIFLLASCTREVSENIQESIFLEIPDSRFESILIAQGIDSDGIVNQKMLRKDAEAITQLDLNLLSPQDRVTDLTGISGFTNLRFLSAAMHDIEKIDLSKNVKLDTLFLQGNLLVEIDLSTNQNLKYVDVSANLLKSIAGLSNLLTLNKLDVSFNELDSVHFKNESVELVLASNNLLTSFKIENALNLTGLILTSNKLPEFNSGDYSMLETLVISDNLIQEIDLKLNPHLHYLRISSNALVKLDVSSNLQLVELRADRNPDLFCIQISSGQDIPTLSLSAHQGLSLDCN